MNVKFIDFSEQYAAIKDEIDVGLKQVFEKCNFILGEEEQQFEEDFARYCDARYAVGVNSGTDALYLALSALEVQPGDEVLIPTFTFIATALCISYTGAKPVFVDIDDETGNIDATKLEAAITPKTKAIMPVHIYGQPADMRQISEIARKHDLKVIEDAAQSHGATYGDRKVGSLGDVGCFSFYPTKSLGAFGDGGMIVTNEKYIYEKALMLRDYGRRGRYDHKVKGFNSRLDTVQAVVLAAKLKHLDEWNQMRKANYEYYCEQFNGTGRLKMLKVKDNRTHVFQTFAVRVDNRDELVEEMKKKGIGVLIHYPVPLHLQEAYAELGHKPGDFPVSERMAQEVMSLPMYPHMSKEEIEYVASTLKELLGA